MDGLRRDGVRIGESVVVCGCAGVRVCSAHIRGGGEGGGDSVKVARNW